MTPQSYHEKDPCCCLECYIHSNNNNPKGLCKSMKDVHEVFEEYLKEIINNTGVDTIYGCFRLCADLSLFSALADYSEGVFIAEIAENIFLDVGGTINEYEIDKSDATETLGKIKNELKTILSCYKNDPNALNSALKTMVFTSRKFCVRCRKEAIKETETT